MVRSPCCHDGNLKKGPWTPEEDEKLKDYINKHGHGSWRLLPKLAGLKRCGKSCRLRWTNYLRPDIKRGKFSDEEERLIINLHSVLGNKWSTIASHLPGRTDNEIKNYWNTHIRKKLLQMGIDPNTHKPRTDFNLLVNLSQLLGGGNMTSVTNPWNNIFKLYADETYLAKIQLLQNLLQIINTSTLPNVRNISSLSPQIQNPHQELGNNNLVESITEAGMSQGGALNMENVSFNSLFDIQSENRVPKIASASASPETRIIFDQVECNPDPLNYLPDSPSFTLPESLEKLCDDDTSCSFWKDILESTTLLQSPQANLVV